MVFGPSKQNGQNDAGRFRAPRNELRQTAHPPIWFTYAAFKHNAQGQVIGYEDSAPGDSTQLDFTYDGITHHPHSTPTLFDYGYVRRHR